MTALLILAMAFALGTLVCRGLFVITVVGRSMSPTLPPGSRVLTVRSWPARALRRGQIAVVTPGLSPDVATDLYIKRIAGLPGDTIVVPGSGRPTHVPRDSCFVLGDNHEDSVDSRTWGALPLPAVRGVVVARLPPARHTVAPPAARMVGVTPGERAPRFSARRLDGATVSSADFAGRPWLMVVFMPCEPARAAMPSIEAVGARAREAGITVVLVSLVSEDPTREFLREVKTSLPALVAPVDENPLRRDYRIAGWPCFCLVDENGCLRASGFPGELDPEWRAVQDGWGRDRGAISPSEVAAL